MDMKARLFLFLIVTLTLEVRPNVTEASTLGLKDSSPNIENFDRASEKSLRISSPREGDDCGNSNTLEVDPESCHNFLQCNHGKWVSVSCPANLVFNPNGQYCDYETNVKCGSNSPGTMPPTTTAATTKAPETTIVTTTVTTQSAISGPREGDDCGNSNTLEVDPESCHNFLQCNHGKWVSVSCPANLVFNPNGQYCDYETNVKCGSNSPGTMPPTTTAATTKAPETTIVTTTVTTQSAISGPREGDDCGNSNTLEVDPESCHNFLQCNHGKWVSVSCPTNLVFNPNGQYCDYETNVKCGSNSPGTMPPTTTAATTKAPETTIVTTTVTTQSAISGPREGDDCGNSNTLEVDPESCHNFLQCNHGKWVSVSCPTNLVFNPNGQYCDYETNVKCGSNSPATTPPMEDATTSAATTSTVAIATGAPTTSMVNTTIAVATTSRGDTTAATINTAPTTPTTTTYPAPSGWPAEHDYKIVCYFTNWAWYRPEGGKYKPEHIDPNLCTHIVYGFAVLDYSNLIIKAHDGWADFDNEFYRKVTDFKKKGIKVTLAIGGWNDSQGDKYSRLVNNPSARAKFNKHVVDFILKHNFDGLDLDWEYPVCWQTECKENRKSDKQGFADWVSELKAAFKPHNLLLSAAVSPSKKIIDLGYDVPRIANDLDWIAVMSYDYHGHWDKKTGHVSPMYEHPEDSDKTFNTNVTIHYWLEKGADKKKIVMGMPMYGRTFTLADVQNNGLNAPASQGGQAGLFTRAVGFLAYYEICEKIQQGYQVVEDPEGRMGPYAFQGNQWVGYDDIKMIKYKSEYIRRMGLGGGMIWALDLDDFNNRCGQGKHPLLSTIKGVLGPNIGQYPVVDNSEL